MPGASLAKCIGRILDTCEFARGPVEDGRRGDDMMGEDVGGDSRFGDGDEGASAKATEGKGSALSIFLLLDGDANML